MPRTLAFLVDVDNTLLNNDLIKIEIKRALDSSLGIEEANQFWINNNYFREHKLFVNFPYVIREYCAEKHNETGETVLHNIFTNMDFSRALYPHAIEVLEHLKRQGEVRIYTEGEPEYQNAKVVSSKLNKYVDEVFIFEQKLEHINEVLLDIKAKAKKLIYIDDKSTNLDAFKRVHKDTHTIRVLQGHYILAEDQNKLRADETVDGIKQLLNKQFN